jgi:hypothetical protein
MSEANVAAKYPREQAMKNGIEERAAFYRGYLIDDRSLVPLAIILATTVVLWLLVYLVSAIGPQGKLPTAQPAAQASTPVSGPVSP